MSRVVTGWATHRATGRNGSLGLVLVASGGIGWFLGIASVDWQWVIEHAQVLAGVVVYPPHHPLAVHQAGAWSVLSQVCAIALRLGATEATLSWIVSGLLGVVSCQALATIMFACSRRALVSVAALFVVLLSRSVDWGIAYPISLYGTSHTYGVAGLSLAALSLALTGAGACRSGAFLLGVLPAVHASIGAFVMLIVVVGWLWEAAVNRPAARARLRRVAVALAAGGAVTLLSFVAHLVLSPHIPSVTAGEGRPYLLALLRFWDGHRQPVPWGDGSVRIAAGLAIVGTLWLGIARSLTPTHTAFLLRTAVSAGGLGLIASAATWIPVERQPDWLIGLMPGRLLNLALLLGIPVLIGLAFSVPGVWGGAISLVLTLGLIGSRRSLLWPLIFGEGEGAPPWAVDQLSVIGVVAVLLGVAAWRTRRQAEAIPHVPPSRRAVRLLGGALALVMVAGIVPMLILTRRESIARAGLLRDWSNDPVFASAAGAGLLLTGGDLRLIQLRTRRPVLLDGGALDVLPYGPEAAPEVERVLNGVYGMSLMIPPPGLRKEGRVPNEINRAVWEHYTREDWHRIGREFGVTRVLTYAGWQLALPSLMTGNGLQVFEIPLAPGK